MHESGFSCYAPLFVPADRPDRFAKAGRSGADAVIIDLEDAVPPDRKVRAREALWREMLPAVPTLIRINGTSTEWFEGDVAAALRLGVECLLLPKSESIDDVRKIRAMAGALHIVALIETARGLANARNVAAAGVARLAFGSIDYCADLGCAHEREVLLPARSELVLASRLAGICPPLDGVTAQIDGPEEARADARHACGLGFAGKMCIHPNQIAPVKAGFMPTASEVSWASSVLASPDGGALEVAGTMVDAPVRQRARQILARHRLV